MENTEEIFNDIDISAKKTDELFKNIVENIEVIFKDIMIKTLTNVWEEGAGRISKWVLELYGGKVSSFFTYKVTG